MKQFVLSQLMVTFFFWREFLGNEYPFFFQGPAIFQVPAYSGDYMLAACSCWSCCRRDARKAVYLQHGILDSSMG